MRRTWPGLFRSFAGRRSYQRVLIPLSHARNGQPHFQAEGKLRTAPLRSRPVNGHMSREDLQRERKCAPAHPNGSSSESFSRPCRDRGNFCSLRRRHSCGCPRFLSAFMLLWQGGIMNASSGNFYFLLRETVVRKATSSAKNETSSKGKRGIAELSAECPARFRLVMARHNLFTHF